MRKFKRSKTADKPQIFAFSKYLDDPLISLAFLVVALVALLLSILNFFQAVN
ncbi:hypothetical protein HY024_03295 [Candidatus Curtissbacteria bacterium]|nr:hypothetical protein [Candidatus Curtissbacteria bacterium]